MKFREQFLNQGQYQKGYQQTRMGFISFITLPWYSYGKNRARKYARKAWDDLMASANDWRKQGFKQEHLIG